MFPSLLWGILRAYATWFQRKWESTLNLFHIIIGYHLNIIRYISIFWDSIAFFRCLRSPENLLIVTLGYRNLDPRDTSGAASKSGSLQISTNVCQLETHESQNFRGVTWDTHQLFFFGIAARFIHPQPTPSTIELAEGDRFLSPPTPQRGTRTISGGTISGGPQLGKRVSSNNNGEVESESGSQPEGFR